MQKENVVGNNVGSFCLYSVFFLYFVMICAGRETQWRYPIKNKQKYDY